MTVTICSGEDCKIVANGNLLEVLLRLKQGLSPNAFVDSYGTTLLMIAATHKQYDIIETFIDHGADVYHQNSHGLNAIACAALYEDFDMVQFLCQYYTDKDRNPDAFAKTLKLFISDNNIHGIKFMLERNANPFYIIASDGLTSPFYIAVQKCEADMWQPLHVLLQHCKDRSISLPPSVKDDMKFIDALTVERVNKIVASYGFEPL